MRSATIRQCAVLGAGGTAAARRQDTAALRRPAVPRLAAARVRPFRRRGVRVADGPLSDEVAARMQALSTRCHARPHHRCRGAGPGGRRQCGVACARTVGREVPSVRWRLAVRLQPRRAAVGGRRGGPDITAGWCCAAGVQARACDVVSCERIYLLVNAGSICSIADVLPPNLFTGGRHLAAPHRARRAARHNRRRIFPRHRHARRFGSGAAGDSAQCCAGARCFSTATA